MRRLTAVSLGDWLHVLRPSPARLERAFEDGCAIEIDEISVTLIDERTFLVGGVHLLDVESGHFRPPGSVMGSVAIHSQRYGTSTAKINSSRICARRSRSNCLKTWRAPAGEARGVSATRATWWGAARAPVAAIWCARPLPISH